MDFASISSDSDTSENDKAIFVTSPILPEKSKKRYELTYNLLKEWCTTKNIKMIDINEKILTAYFQERSQILQSPSSLWCEYSMLKTTVYLNDNLDISQYQKLKAFLKKKNLGYRPKKAPVFTQEDVVKFLTEAPDDIYLMKKVVVILALAGACRTDELCQMRVDDIEDKGNFITINIPNSETKTLSRSFIIIDNEREQFHCLSIFRKYANLRPEDTQIMRFFLKYQNGKCHRQVVGRHSFRKIPSAVAKFLNLDDYQKYTGYSFRRTSATLLANSGVLSLKSHDVWKADTITVSTNKAEESNKVFYNDNTHEHDYGPSSSGNLINFLCIKVENETKENTNSTKKNISSFLNVGNMLNCVFNTYWRKQSNELICSGKLRNKSCREIIKYNRLLLVLLLIVLINYNRIKK